ncbi:hypothetical protein GC163_12775 [bacterium]|nr:hypothetical protein [bacterium]
MSGTPLVDGAAQLREAAELLEQTWARSESHWNDAVRKRFEEERLQELRKQLALAQGAIQQLSDVLMHAVRQASDADRNG